jgi:hypothetical protein
MGKRPCIVAFANELLSRHILFSEHKCRSIFAPSIKKQTTNMKKIIVVAAALLSLSTAASAQTNASGTAQQTLELGLTNALSLVFTGSGTTTGTTVNLPFTSVNDYSNGVESAPQQLKVQSNKPFNVTVAASATNFSVTNGSTTTTSTMPVAGVLDVKVDANQTGGTVGTGYSTYGAGLSTSASSIINGGSFGNNQTFDVKYKATPGFAYPAGVYAVDVIYTATQQ